MTALREDRRIFMLAPVGEDGLCTGCGTRPTRETGRCRCLSGPASRYLPDTLAIPSTEGLRDRENWECVDDLGHICERCGLVIPATPTEHPAGLDVGRHRQAVSNVLKAHGKHPWWPPTIDLSDAIAAEYARLSDRPTETGEQG